MNALNWAHPLVQEWFSSKFGTVTEPQKQGWPAILAGKSTLISAPTGSGKTLTAFLACLNDLVVQSLSQELTYQTQVVYVSPLKALSNDIQKNLLEPLSEIKQLAKKQDLSMSEISVLVRTGDTLAAERQKMLKKPPHILVTTPESLYILLTAEKSRLMLTEVKTIIIDEIHALINNKRGAHLALSLERLNAITKQHCQRIGLSATQKPIEAIAHFLTGSKRSAPIIVNVGHTRPLEMSIEVPKTELGPIASNDMWDEIYDKLTELSKQNRSTLIFVNTRRLAERVAHHLSERLGEDQVAAHHGSLSRKLRLEAETKLKNGELKALVATASLELGIDIGTIDLVCQIGTTRSIAVALQRIGRSGHWLGAISKGIFFATTLDELVECAALIYAIKQGDLDELIIPSEPLDILSQQIVAACAAGDWLEEDLFRLIKKSEPYHNLTRKSFNEIVAMLSEGIVGSRGRYSAYIFHDKVNKLLKARRGSRLTAITSGGAIPDNGLFTVVAEPDGVMVGTLDEDFAVESNRGDVILLGTTSWIVERIESVAGKVIVSNANGAAPSVPFWRGEAPGRTKELSSYVAFLRQKISDMLPLRQMGNLDLKNEPNRILAMQWLKENTGLNNFGSEQLLEYLLKGRAVLGAVPTQDTIIAERFFDESGGMQLIIHAPFGMRINKAWGLALRKCFCQSFNFELQAAATDNGLNISLAEQHSFPLADVFNFLHPNSVLETITQSVLQSPIFNIRWRWVASRSLALVRFRKGKKVPPNIQRMLADDLLAAVFPDAAACQDNIAGRKIELPSHPLITETMKDILTDALDVAGLIDILDRIRNGSVKCLAVDTPVASVFAHEILNVNPYGFLDDAPLEERRARAVEMRRFLPASALLEVGKLDPMVIEEVQQQAWPDIRSADELQDSIQTFIALPLDIHLSQEQTIKPEWHFYLDELIKENRIGVANYESKQFLVAAEKITTFLKIYPLAKFTKPIQSFAEENLDRDEALTRMIKGYLFHVGPISSQELSETLNLKTGDVDETLLKLEAAGVILRGQFRSIGISLEWCERRLLARIHKNCLIKLRNEIQAINPNEFMRWLFKWQHLAKGSKLRGEKGLLEVIKQLQGFEIAANAWEPQIFAKRIQDYDRSMLDYLCFNGRIGWGRLSPHPKLLIEEEDNNKNHRLLPTSIVPITFYIREELETITLTQKLFDIEKIEGLSLIAKQIFQYLLQKGASFLADIVRGIHHLESEVELGLWELIAVGAITADSFDNLRAIIDPKRRRLNKRNRYARSYSSGRWSILHKVDQDSAIVDSNINPEKNVDLNKDSKNSNSKLEAFCKILLNRYGVVFRDLLTREKNMPRWRELLLAFRRLEDRGDIRGGRFVNGFYGEQFALPEALQSLRATEKKDMESIRISAGDPLNLVGIIVAGQKVAANSKESLLFDGVDFIE